ncbi:hypothetical protein ACTGWY_10890, partial [Streptococcus suis]
SSLVTQGVLGSLLRSGIAGIRELMWANVMVLCSLLLFTPQANPAMPPWLAIQAPNVLISSGVVLFCAGVFRFMQQRPPWRLLLLGLALSIGANIWFHYVDPSV